MFDWDSLYGEASAKATAGGKRRFYDNRVKSVTTCEEDGKFCVKSVVDGDTEYHVEISFDEQGGLYDYDCDCSEDKVGGGPCRHIVATAIYYENEFPNDAAHSEKRAVMRSDAGVRSLVDLYGRLRRGRRIGLEGDKVRITPTMEVDGGRLTLRFTIGSKKQYVLKDIADFVSCCNTGAEKRYGVELTVVHLPESFDEFSAKLMAFICGVFREKSEYLEGTVQVGKEQRDRLRLTAGGVDEFIELCSGQYVTCDDRLKSGDVRLIEPNVNCVPFGLSIERAASGYDLKSSLGKYSVVHGKKYKYIFTAGRVYPVTDAYYGAVMPLIIATEAHGKLYIAESDMSQFYNSVITRLTEFTEIDAHGIDLSVFEAAPLELKVYIAAGTGGSVVTEVRAGYDSETDVDIFNDNISYPFVRDYESENAFIDILRRYYPEYPLLELTDEEDIYALLRDGLREMMGVAEVYLSDDIKRIKVKKPPKIRVGVRLKSDLLALELSSDEYTSEQIAEILSAYRSRKNYVRLTDGTFVDLVDPSLAALGDMTALASEEDGELTMPIYYAPYVNSELRDGSFTLDRSAEFKQIIKDLSGAEQSLADVPKALKNVLRNYQKAGYRWLKTLSRLGFGGILADDMGLGKSLQIISLLLSERGGTSIIVCPTTLVLNWINEFEKFAPEMKVLAISGDSEERKNLVSTFGGYDVIITSYELLRRDSELYGDMQFKFAVIDEAQYIKNPETKNARAVKTLRAEHRFALTGTPVENNLAELWSIFDFLMPGYLFSYPRYRDTLESEIVHGSDDAANKLSGLIKPFILRRLKSAVLKELPPKMESDVVCPLESEQKEVYTANLGLVRESVEAAGEKVNKVVVLGMLTKLRQICCEPRLVYSNYEGNSAKLEACLDLVRTATAAGHKVLVFSQFTTMLDVLKNRLSDEKISYYLLKGETPKAERVKLVSRFNADETSVFLISLKAGGTGLNLTGADVVIHYDPWWNESVMNQATDRAYRIGQDKPVQVYKLIMKDSIEERIMKMQERKNALSGLVMNAASSAANLKYEDILQLLGG